jgi:hypothetical protein
VRFGLAHGRERSGVVVVTAVAEVHSKDFGAGLGQRQDLVTAGGAQGGDDAGVAVANHGFPREAGRALFKHGPAN